MTRKTCERGEAMPLEPECPGPDCMMCNGAACNKCGAGCWNNSAPHCVWLAVTLLQIKVRRTDYMANARLRQLPPSDLTVKEDGE